MSDKFLQIKNVTKQYSNHKALDCVSFDIEEGKVFGLLGPNGAGKTSLIRIINKITAPDSGEVLLSGQSIDKYDIRRIGYLPEERGLYRKMKVGEHAIYLARLKGIDKATAKKRLVEWFEKFEIMSWWDRKIEELSKGMQQKIQFVCTVIHDPDLLIFDEPFSGFDPLNAELLKQEMLGMQKKGKTIIFSTHNMQSVEEVCQDIALINSSKVVLMGSVAQIRKNNSTGIVSVHLKTTDISFLTSRMNIIEHKMNDDTMFLRIKKEDGMTNRDVISIIPQECEIVSFEEEMPTMNEIFIKTISKNEK